jgi:hypothetical protein
MAYVETIRMDVANITTVTLPSGDIFGYACLNGSLQKYHLNISNAAGVNSQISLASNGPVSSCSLAAVLGMDENQTPMRHVFYNRGDNSLWYLLDQPAAEDETYTGIPAAVASNAIGSPAMAGGFGAVSNSDGIILVGVTSKADHPSITFVTIPWAAMQTQTWLQGATAAVYDLTTLGDPTLLGHTFDYGDCDVDCTLVTQPSSGSQIVIWVARMKDSTGQNYLHAYCVQVAPGLQLSSAWDLGGQGPHGGWGRAVACNWDPTNPIASASSIKGPKIMCRPDNLIEVYYFDNNWHAQALGMLVANFFDVSSQGDANADRLAWAPQNDLPVITKMSQGQDVANVSYGNNLFEVVFLSGEPESHQSTNNPNLEDIVMPLYAAVIYWSNGNLWSITSQPLWAYIARKGLPSVQGNQVLLGIIEGAPPIPDENLNLSSTWDPYTYMGQPGYAAAAFAASQTQSSAMSLGWSAGLIASASVKYGGDVDFWIFEVGGYLKGTLELQLAYRGAYSKQSSSTYVSTTSTHATLQQDPTTGDYSVQPAGSMLLMDASWTGYQYVVTDSTGNTIPTATTVVQLFATNQEVASVPYLIPPPQSGSSSVPVPGELMTYVLPPDEEQALQQNSVIQMKGGINYLTNSWGYNTGTLSNFTTTDQSSWSHGLTFDLKALLTAGGVAKLYGVVVDVELTAGIRVTFEATWTWLTSSSTTIGADLRIRGNSQAPDAYTYYVFYVYMLAENPQWWQDLQPLMLTTTWPADANQRTQQQQLLQIIASDSAPWKICYAVDPEKFHFNQPASAVFAARPELQPALEQTFSGAGIRTTQNIRDLLAAADTVRSSGGIESVSQALASTTGGTPVALQDLIGTLNSLDALGTTLNEALTQLQVEHRTAARAALSRQPSTLGA